MARRLRRTVVAGGVVHPAGTPETAALLKAITNPRAWEGEPDPEPAETTSSSRRSTSRKKAGAKAEKPAEGAPAAGGDTSTPDGGGDGSGGEETPQEPPRGGEGSGEDVWREYATGLGIEVPEDAGRDDIVALVDAARASNE